MNIFFLNDEYLEYEIHFYYTDDGRKKPHGVNFDLSFGHVWKFIVFYVPRAVVQKHLVCVAQREKSLTSLSFVTT